MWNKYKKYILIAVFSIIILIIIDISQALIFQNSPVLKIREHFDGGTLYYKDKGLITYTYNCIGEKRKTVLKWEKFSCPLKETTFEIIDESKNIKDFICAEALEEIYRDDEYIYFLSCMKSEYIKVNYSPDHFSENIKTALKEGRVKISDLDIFKIDYIKKEISKEQLEKEEQDTDNKEENKKEEQSKKEESNKKDNKTNNDKNNSNQNNSVNKNNNTNNNKENNNESNGQNGGTTKPEENKPNPPKEPEPNPETKTQAEINDKYRKKLENKYSVKIVYKDENGIAKVSILGRGKFKGLKVIEATKTNAEVIKLEAPKYEITAVEYINGLYEYYGDSYNLKIDNTKDQNVRYYGANPNNYVSFNNELWRIIGVFKDNVKLVRKDSLGNLSWDTSESSVNHGWENFISYLSPKVGSNAVWQIYGDGFTNVNSLAYMNRLFFPAIYLKSNVLMDSGNGTSSDLYILKASA